MNTSPAKSKPPLIRWQAPMLHVLAGLAPLIPWSVYLFGWRALVMVLLMNAVGFLAEYVFVRGREPVSSAILVTNTLFALSLPPTLPFWMAIVGILVAVIFGKMVFGGFGRNIFNPALVGRAFIYVTFAGAMNAEWQIPFAGWPGGFAHYSALSPDALTSATPLRLAAAGNPCALSDLFWGRVPGSLGETSSFLILLGGLYIIWRKAASYRIVLGGMAALLVLQSIFWWAGLPRALHPAQAVFGGSFLFGLLFFATEPVSASQTNPGRWIYGALIGLLSVLIRQFSVWPEGLMFAILLANTFAPILDYAVKSMTPKKEPI